MNVHRGVLLALALTACSSSSGKSEESSQPAEDAGQAGAEREAGTSQEMSDEGGASAVEGGAPFGKDAGSTENPGGGNPGGGGTMFSLPPLNAGLDYQLGGAYPPAPSVKIISRDRTAPIAKGLYNICYVNGFQIQPGEEAAWMGDHPELILRDKNGQPVIDADWNEMLMDVSTPEKRAAVAAIVRGWIEGCAKDGFDAVEIDNLDSFSRSAGLLDADDAVATVKLFAAAAHEKGLAIAQKNSAELVGRRAEMGTDFVVAEECNRYDECGTYTAAYGDHVLVIEYRRQDFTKGCTGFPNLSIVLRDRNLVAPGHAEYLFDGC